MSNVNVNKNKIWYANAAGRPYPASRARTSLQGPLDFGGSRDVNIRGNVRSAGGEAEEGEAEGAKAQFGQSVGGRRAARADRKSRERGGERGDYCGRRAQETGKNKPVLIARANTCA